MNNIFFTGIVENRTGDPLKIDRCQVRVFGVHTEALDDIPTSALPWAICLGHDAAISGIGESGAPYLEGTLVSLYFQDGESKQQPMIMGSFKGISVAKTPFNQSSLEDIPSVVQSKVTSTVKPTSDDTLVDTAGNPVVDSSGAPVVVSTAVGLCCDSVDTSAMSAKFGPNVAVICKTLCDFGIKDPYAVVAILSNIAKECKFKPVRESMNYSSISRLRDIFKTKFKNLTDDQAQVYVSNEEGLANFVYSNSEGNGSVESGDGFNYRGGGFIQLTKKNNYLAVGSKIGVDLTKNTNLVNDSSIGPKVMAQYFVNRFGGANRLKFSSLEEAITVVTRKVNPGGFDKDYPIVKGYSALCKIVLDEAAMADAKATEELTKPNDPENDLKRDATKQEIDAGVVNGSTKKNNSAVGFSDPSGKYPLSSMLKEQDTNRLSRRNTSNTSVHKRLSARRTGVRSIGGVFNEPAPAYNAQYPFNHVRATESGHIQEFDDTHGNERIHTYHTSGTFQEVDKYGNRINKIVGDDFTIVERNGYIYIDGTCRITVGSDVKLVVQGNAEIEVDGDVNWDVGGDFNIKAGGKFSAQSGGDASILSGASVAVQSGGGFSVSGGSASSIDAPMLDINSGVSVRTGVNVSARSGQSNDYPPLIPENFLDAESISFDDASEGDVAAFHEKSISNNTITKQELEMGDAAVPEVIDTKPASNIEPIPASCAAFDGKTNIPESTQLSKSFTLAMLSTKAKAGGHKVVAQHGLTEAQIVCNLKMCAENCLDAIKSKYPNMYVTSGFRSGSSSSQHERGQAIDMQFDVPNGDYFAIAQWIRDNVVFDKMLLEYKTNRSGKAWLHVAYRENPRREVYTYMNDKNAGTGLRKLQ